MLSSRQYNAAFGPHAAGGRMAQRADCKRSAWLTYEPSRSAKRRAGQLVRRPIPQRRLEHILHDQLLEPGESGGRGFVDPGAADNRRLTHSAADRAPIELG